MGGLPHCHSPSGGVPQTSSWLLTGWGPLGKLAYLSEPQVPLWKGGPERDSQTGSLSVRTPRSGGDCRPGDPSRAFWGDSRVLCPPKQGLRSGSGPIASTALPWPALSPPGRPPSLDLSALWAGLSRGSRRQWCHLQPGGKGSGTAHRIRFDFRGRDRRPVLWVSADHEREGEGPAPPCLQGTLPWAVSPQVTSCHHTPTVLGWGHRGPTRGPALTFQRETQRMTESSTKHELKHREARAAAPVAAQQVEGPD